AKQPSQHWCDFTHDVPDVKDAGGQDLLSAEGQQLLRERSGAMPRLRDLVKLRAMRAVWRQAFEGKLRVSKNRGQHVVEIVCDAAGQLPNRLHFLRLSELFLERSLFGQVHGETGAADGLAGRVVREIGGRGDVTHAPI